MVFNHWDQICVLFKMVNPVPAICVQQELEVTFVTRSPVIDIGGETCNPQHKVVDLTRWVGAVHPRDLPHELHKSYKKQVRYSVVQCRWNTVLDFK
jgi:hypothetical protein